MPPDPAAEGREAALVANRIRELNTRPPIGEFDRTHLQAVHAYLFQDLPHHRPGEIRGDTSGWSKTRMLEGQTGAHDVHYAPDNVAGRVDKVLRDLGGPAALSGLPPDAFAGRMARLYGDLDHAHSFYVMLNCKCPNLPSRPARHKPALSRSWWTADSFRMRVGIA